MMMQARLVSLQDYPRNRENNRIFSLFTPSALHMHTNSFTKIVLILLKFLCTCGKFSINVLSLITTNCMSRGNNDEKYLVLRCRIREYFTEKQWSHLNLAHELGLTPITVSRFLRGHDIKLSKALKLASLLDKPVEELFELRTIR